MKKIMLDDRHGLTEAVMQGKKTMTRRVFKSDPALVEQFPIDYIIGSYANYEVGEVVAIAQSYKDAGVDENKIVGFTKNRKPILAKESAGWTNKLFVKADLMTHHIQITNVRLERLQDISEADCLKEGIEVNERGIAILRRWDRVMKTTHYPCEHSAIVAFADLMENIIGKGTWEKNPYIFVYEFKMID